ncbi:NAD(P)-binding domain-containing protein [Streptomyces sp. 8L]|uniref:NAD(P)-binding domain-containing protein n=1 Tax=Streptomyces sp. 8L TaxID=2877242 RepID=UPI001CD45D43|nr:NAD(P)-binding domain-containing protein [Streptomyces sp. 8L]MCA1221052.1 NAD(P)-binding domain-containing protein [Streptomyces sp. 8L]
MSDEVQVDYLILGAGPAGLQAGYFLEKSGRSYLILESGDAPGTFFTKYPRHRTLISSNKVHTGWTDPELRLRNDWNSLLADEGPLFTGYTPRYFPPADVLVRYLADFARTHGLRIRYGTRAERISRPAPSGPFVVRDQHGNEFRGKRLIVATGVTKAHVPDIEGVETAERYTDVSVDPRDFTDQRVLVIGRGNSAFETADNLIENAAVIHLVGPGSLRLAWQTHFVGHLRAVNNNFLDTYQLKSQNALLEGTVQRIRKEGEKYVVSISFDRVEEVVKDIPYDRVILATGFRFDASIFSEECRPELTIKNRFPAQTDAWESVNIPDMYFAGTLTQVRDFKKSTSGFIHGFRYGVRALHHILERRYHGLPWPARDLQATAGAVSEAVIERVNRSSALWQQFGFLGDAVLIGTDGAVRYCEEVPVRHLHSAVAAGTTFEDVAAYFTVTLEYGADHDVINPFDVSVRRPGQEDTTGLDGRYLHPVVRHFVTGSTEPAGEHHLTENLENEWDREAVHRAPLRTFLQARLTAGQTVNSAG